MVDQIYAIISILIAASAIISLKVIERVKFRKLVGSYKAIVVISILIVIAELMYLSISFRWLVAAIETVTSLSALLIFFAFVYLNKLQNAASGLSIALSPRISVGDYVEVENKRGKIVQLGLTKTVVELEGTRGQRMWIPNKKFDEVIAIMEKPQKDFQDKTIEEKER